MKNVWFEGSSLNPISLERSSFWALIFYFLNQVVVEAVKALFGEEKEENLLASLTTIMNCCDGEQICGLGYLMIDIFKVT